MAASQDVRSVFGRNRPNSCPPRGLGPSLTSESVSYSLTVGGKAPAGWESPGGFTTEPPCKEALPLTIWIDTRRLGGAVHSLEGGDTELLAIRTVAVTNLLGYGASAADRPAAAARTVWSAICEDLETVDLPDAEIDADGNMECELPEGAGTYVLVSESGALRPYRLDGKDGCMELPMIPTTKAGLGRPLGKVSGGKQQKVPSRLSKVRFRRTK